jgi:dinuclear metal center YbgI/SA1388 family protein
MKVRDITTVLENFAPLATQEAYDNAGLITGSPEMEATGALLCVDVTEAVLDEAVAAGVNLVIAHHPIIFLPLKSLAKGTNVDRVVAKAVKNDIAIYACHTNLDRAPHGMGFALARQLGLQNIREGVGPEGFGAVGELPEAMGEAEFLRMVQAALGAGCIRHSAPRGNKVRTVAVINGAGGDGLEDAIDAGSDAFLSADVRHDRFLAAEGRILLADVGHYESEFCAVGLMFDIITKKFPNFAVRPSANATNPVNYLT